MSEIIAQATHSQRQAADPRASVWVGANAGTGKTKVLTDRVLNLLLEGTGPERILCLTFTKAAAAEMSTRLAAKLSDWAVISDEALDQALRDLGRIPDAAQRTVARRLFARLLDVPGGMRIETIHAFCQSLLRRFPLEAGVSPHFEVLDERSSAELMDQAYERLLQTVRAGGDSPLARALAVVTAQVHEMNFPALMGQLTGNRGKLRRLLRRHGGLDEALAALYRVLEVAEGETAADIRLKAVAVLDGDELRSFARMMASGGKTDQGIAESLARWFTSSPPDQASQWELMSAAFLTKDGAARSQSKYPSKAVKETYPDVLTVLDQLTDTVLLWERRYKAAQVAECSAALLVLGNALISGYEAAKEQRGLMDFDDLIFTTRALLSGSEATAWVLYKLDGGIDHVMVDEAQDNSPDQWGVIRSLTEEFFSGEGRINEAVRTVFAVGDRKQSIYSFQGADPAAFDTMRARYREVVPAAEQTFHDVTLGVSFRSVSAVLDLVDQVFNATEACHGVRERHEPVHHLAAREGMAGLVELWPVLETAKAADGQPWKPPVEVVSGDTAQARLARLLAARIKAMISGERLLSQDRPMTAGDILVLVRRRGGFVEDLVRALKKAEVPVAGADRMVLSEQMAVMDLLALGEALLLPDDDLTLACVLKGPLIGLSEDQLLQIAAGRPRGVSLWRSLRAAAEKGGGPFRPAHETLADLMGQADFLPPHELYARVLGPLRGREKLVARLGPDALDAIDEFVQLTLTYDRGNPPSLQGFLHWARYDDSQKKRDMAERRDEVRVMTVHGSKGLQAPVVILPDTCGVPSKLDSVLWEDEHGLMLWPPRKEMRDPLSDQQIERLKDAQLQEYNRLLYVALTRAEDRLLVCGWQGKTRRPEGCWYDLVEAGMAAIGQSCDDPFLSREGPAFGVESATIWRLQSAQTVAPRISAHGELAMAAEEAPLPAWTAAPPPAEPSPPRPLAPSRVELPDPPARSPLDHGDNPASDAKRRFRRGTLVHRLLQSLPDLAPLHRQAAAATFLARPVWELSPAAQAALCRETLAVLDHPDIAPLFGPGSLAEVPITGVVGGHVVSGQVDRLVVTDEAVLIVDFKTNRPPPRRVEDVAEAYCVQLALYRQVLQGIYPGRRVDCALVWTDGPFVMPLPRAVLEASLKNNRLGGGDSGGQRDE
ncbi:double-strand break repair helicase AddA [Insolitispirillum peregrinum]|uniref:DNA 3'-5' helicase n=1 Tax=Insolitispirillum peregrinum TaxID=80876 RepID=A0A1N7JJN6_9PROT|nr:double-strand break repair helicase AddA [Insolitispirillum peregrinum]SIS49535.1 DNA helicase/exodeoxyribonuclease V, subunit A [Insolitispirillum peregrinum]